jgi:hypothetical protein
MPAPKNVILLSDGTGNAADQVWKSNAWRVFESLDLRGDGQIAVYDDGVGTSSFKPLAVLGGAFGWGLKRNVLDIYKFLCVNYKLGDKIYGFGFSRGAFTMRVVIGLVLNQGLVQGSTEAEIYDQAKMAYRAYRAERFHTVLLVETIFRVLRNIILFLLGQRYDKTKNMSIEQVEFLGLWDTVAAYGLPVDEMARGVSQWLLPLELPDRSFNPKIRRACHALSLDDERTTFHPVLWNEKSAPVDQLCQAWFAGVHSNVGGGYPDDSLAHIPLYWIMKEAEARGLLFKTAPNTPNDPDPDMLVFAEWRRDKDGRLYDSRNGSGGYYRYGPRKIEELSHQRFSFREDDYVDNGPPIIHETAIVRARAGAHRYALIGVPQTYTVMTDKGIQPQTNFETPTAATARCGAQDEVWNAVWRRRFIYFITVFASLYIVIYPLATKVDSSGEFVTRLTLVSVAIRAAGPAGSPFDLERCLRTRSEPFPRTGRTSRCAHSLRRLPGGNDRRQNGARLAKLSAGAILDRENHRRRSLDGVRRLCGGPFLSSLHLADAHISRPISRSVGERDIGLHRHCPLHAALDRYASAQRHAVQVFCPQH